MILVLLFSCSGNNISSSSLVDNSITSEEISNSDADLSTENIYYWNESVLEDIRYALGEYELPYFASRSHYSERIVNEGVKYVKVICAGINVETAIESYEAILSKNGFSISNSYEVPLAYKEVSLLDDQYIEFYINNNRELEIISCVVRSRMDTWPDEYISSVLGYSVPKVEAKSYELYVSYADNGNDKLIFYCYGVNHNCDTEYADILKQKGYETEDVSGMIFAKNNLLEINIEFYMYAGDILYVQMYSTKIPVVEWPSEEIISIIGVDLPHYKEDGVTYDTRYITSSDEKQIFTIYCDGASSTSIDCYKDLLIENDWVLDSEVDFEQYGYVLYLDRYCEEEHMVQLVYSYQYQCLAIAVHY